MLVAYSPTLSLAPGNSKARTTQDHVEIHPIDPDARVVLDAQVNVLLDPKAKVPHFREVVLS